MDNIILDKIKSITSAGRHILYIDVTQLSLTNFELRLTLQDWSTGADTIAGEDSPIDVIDFERLPDVVCDFEATVEMVEDWMIEVAKVGDAVDVAKFERDGYRNWLTKPFAWRKGK